MNNLKVFNFEDKTIRTILKEGTPLWVLKDVCLVLGISKHRDAADRLDADEREPVIVDTLGGPQEMICINESGLYNIIFLSRKPKAKKFRRWVTHEVLPSIRKHGLYAVDEVLDNPDILIKALEELKVERTKNNQLTETISIQGQQITEMQPKASYYDVVLNCKEVVAISVIAKDYGKSARWLNKYLHVNGIQFKQGKIWLLYQEHAQFGYTATRTHTFQDSNGCDRSSVHTYWTQKGRLFIYELLKDNGLLPLIEQNS